ncbi:formylglycine-generating enzyme required for sulfatase activity [Caulobacter ginsengisoli]|uniref:Formylglycine-generating enzyme required for sulfatase activity n=1 Tax=Caulobacter ginsengisoli TaxID=400775 RepID=A0ABU0IRR4_9CAUL|nr:formylglycine-generating enzyme family protein [Caulobacter ginsengisoli]MDQ0463709.1 formylglycine-generating enzyme required for sulfatase activity [Caulobacter ginsengisoli]
MTRSILILLGALTLGACAPKLAVKAPAACQTGLVVPTPDQPQAGMVLIKGGRFEMGAQPRHREEGPPRRTRVGDFWIDRTEVTNADFARFVAATGYVTQAERPLDPAAYPGLTKEQRRPSSLVFVPNPKADLSNPADWWRVIQGANWRHPQGPGSDLKGRDSFPVVQVSWADAKAYAKWLGRDLPTEAEWEYASRGGLDGAAYSWGQTYDKAGKPMANIWQGVFPAFDSGGDGYKAQTAPAGCYPANGYGLFDMAGNVWEWTNDWYAPGLNPADGDDPQGPSDALDPANRSHVIKGGSFLCADNYCYRYRPAAREVGPPDTGSSHVGFRTVLRVRR